MSKVWKIRLGRQAELDYVEILSWTTKHFSKVQAQTYSETITQAIQALTDGPEILDSKRRDEIELGIRTLHVARLERKGRHIVVFRVDGVQTIDVLRLLHETMDLPRHLPNTHL
jgi:toxin ParE1/3/4